MKISIKNPVLLLLTGLFFGTALVSCDSHNDRAWEFARNMYDSKAYEPLSQTEKNTINPNGMNMRTPVKGTVSRRNYATSFGSGDSLTHDLMMYDVDSLEIAAKVLKNPIPYTEQNIASGQVLYERYCQHCHGEAGKGDGLVAKQYKGVPVYSSDALKDISAGHIYYVITNGKGRMWPHKAQVTPEERWKIVQYVQKLQKEG